MTNKEATEKYIHDEEVEFLGRELGEMFVEPEQQTAGYESIKVELVTCTPYYDWIKASVPACFCTWDMSPENPISNPVNGMMRFSPESQESYVLKILRQRPISVSLEHPTFFFQINGVPRAITHQIVRHRQMAFGQQSYRVSSCYNDPVRIPQSLIERGTKEQIDLFNETVAKCRATYKELIQAGFPMEQCRNIMPMGTTTKISVTMRLRDVIDYLKARTSGISQDEHTYMVCLLAKEIKDKQPKYWDFIIERAPFIEEVMKTYKVE